MSKSGISIRKKCDCNLSEIADERDVDDDKYELDLEFQLEFASRYFDKYAKSCRDEMKVLKKENKCPRRLEITLNFSA